ncbi:MAG: RNA polymerase subunit sigma [Sandaracinus sp.]|nr:RNA polymerase subunit sigma [Sandaracinus sp.]
MTDVTKTAPNSDKLAPEDFTDEELRGRMLLRDARAWREFHRRFDRLVYRCIHKVTGRFRRVVGEDDVQEIYAQFLLNLTARDMRKLRQFDPARGNKLGSWIGLLATNAAWDHLRSLSRRPQTTEIDAAHDLSCDDGDPYAAMADKERWELLNQALESFSKKDRTFVKLYFVEGLSPEEVAEVMDVSVKTVYSKKHKIRCRLEEAVASLAA